MSRESKIQYNPALSVKEIAKRSGVSEAAVRYYIKVNNIDRKFDRKQQIIDDCRKYLKKHPDATWDELQEKTGHSLSTMRLYRDFITTEKELTDFDSEKAKKRQLRQLNNYYATHPSVTQDLLREEKFHTKVLEPFCGGGTMAEVIKQSGYEVEAYDLIDRGYGKVGDFFKTDFPKREYDIITNPPYDANLIEIIKRCLSLCKEKVAILMPIRYLSGKERHKELYSKYPPSRVYIYCERVTIAKDGDFEKYSASGANMEIYAWYVWEKGYKGETELRWIHNVKDEKETADTKPKIEKVTVLDEFEFEPYAEYHIPIGDCIQFHSKALPENKVLSNHYECIITFRGVEFYGLEQMYAALNYSDSPNIVKQIMNCTSGKAAKSLCNKKYPDKRDWDFEEKRYRIIALCHLFKYLSCKEFRDRLRETYPKTLVECPNGKDYHFGMVQNLDTNVFEGNNCSGRTMMLVRDIMKKHEDDAIVFAEKQLGRALTDEERETAYEVTCNRVRHIMESSKQVLKDSKPLFTTIEKNSIPKERDKQPKPFIAPVIDTNTKCLVLDFDDTLFDTSADNAYRKCDGKKDMEKAMEMIPQYRLYEGWREVIEWTKRNGVKLAILSAASSKLIEKALIHFNVPYAAIVGYQPYIEKPNTILGNMLQERLNIRHEQIIYVGNSKTDEIQARASQFRFIGATWNARYEDYFKEKGVQTVSSPKELIGIMEAAGWTSPTQPTTFKDIKAALEHFGGSKRAFINGVTAITPHGVIAKVDTTKEKPQAKKTKAATSTAEKPIKQEYPLDGKMYHSVLGAIIGDIAGSSREGHSNNTFKTDFKFFTANSTFTDDTVLTIALADWLNNKDTLKIKKALLKWGRRFPNAGYGSNFRGIVQSGQFGIGFSTANGAAMRVSPVALKAESLKEAIDLAKQSATPSHAGGGVKGAQAIAAATYLAKEGIAKGKSVDKIKAEIKSTVEKKFGYNLNTTLDEIRELTQHYAAIKAKKEVSLFYTRMSNADYSCPEAIIAVLLANTYEEAIRIAVSMGGDSDTIAAMAGGIAAQLFGIPEGLIKRSLVFLPAEMIEVVNAFEGTDFKPTGIAPPRVNRWSKDEVVVYGEAPNGQKGEDGKTETFASKYNHHPTKGYPILTVGQSIEKIQEGVAEFIAEAKEHPERRYHIRKVGYHKAGYTVQQIAPLFKEAVGLSNVLLPEEMLNELTKR